MGNNLLTSEAILNKLKWRYAVKQYDPAKKVSGKDWGILEEALTLAPSSFGLQPYKFIVITDPATREKLKLAAYGQSQVTDASHLVVFAYKKTLSEADVEHFIDRIAEVRRVPRETLTDYENTVKGSASRAVDGGYIEIDTTAAASLEMTVQFSIGNASNIFDCEICSIEFLTL